MIAPYAKVVRTFWTDPEIRALTGGQQRLLLYYISAPQGNMAGLYRQPFPSTALDLRLDVASVKRWTLGVLRKWVTYDLTTLEVLVHNTARYQAGALKPTDRRFDHVKRIVATTRSAMLREKFAALYPELDVLPEPLGDELPTELVASLERHNRRRAQKLRAVVGPVDLQGTWREQHGRCGLCHEPLVYETDLTVEHLRALSRGGSHTQDNVCLAHKRCNSAKGDSLEGASKVPRGSQKAPRKGAVGSLEASSSSSSSSSNRNSNRTTKPRRCAPRPGSTT
jgi:hypothetical protein